MEIASFFTLLSSVLSVGKRGFYLIGMIPSHTCHFSPPGERAGVAPQLVQVGSIDGDIDTSGGVVRIYRTS